jgi:hypothetical protein
MVGMSVASRWLRASMRVCFVALATSSTPPRWPGCVVHRLRRVVRAAQGLEAGHADDDRDEQRHSTAAAILAKTLTSRQRRRERAFALRHGHFDSSAQSDRAGRHECG